MSDLATCALVDSRMPFEARVSLSPCTHPRSPSSLQFKVDPAGGVGAAAAIATDLPGLDGFKVALKPAVTTGDKANKTVDVMLGYDAKDFSIAALG